MNILFFSPHALADSSSGAARCVQTLLEELTTLGHSCRVLTGSVVDGPNHLFQRMLEMPPERQLTAADSEIKIPVRRVVLENVEHVIVGGEARQSHDLPAVEETALLQTFLKTFSDGPPDVTLTYGGFSSNYVAGRYAMSRGCKSAAFIATASYGGPDDLLHANHLVTVSKAMAAYLPEETRRGPMTILAPLVRREQVVASARTPEYITFINPMLGKGLTVAAAIAAACQDRGKPYKFLFVESRGTQADALAKSAGLRRCRNVSFAGNTSDMRAVYARTGVLLFPSLWFESAGRVILEANANGIPVLAHNIGGIPEMMNGAGYLFDPPAALTQDWSAAAPPEYIDRWIDVIDRLHLDENERRAAARRAREADAKYDLGGLARAFAAGVHPAYTTTEPKV
ncbi:MAG: glycosyltransferase family 4 protein [Rhodospirillaceae bacterium]|nr:glycosyltransferase family 4 protein [Rhodospirillaceae bacterium]